MFFCHNCGKQNQDKARFCFNCGSNFQSLIITAPVKQCDQPDRNSIIELKGFPPIPPLTWSKVSVDPPSPQNLHFWLPSLFISIRIFLIVVSILFLLMTIYHWSALIPLIFAVIGLGVLELVVKPRNNKLRNNWALYLQAINWAASGNFQKARSLLQEIDKDVLFNDREDGTCRKAAYYLIEGWCLESLMCLEDAEYSYRQAFKTNRYRATVLWVLLRFLAQYRSQNDVPEEFVPLYLMAYRFGIKETWLMARLALGLLKQKALHTDAEAVYLWVLDNSVNCFSLEQRSLMTRIAMKSFVRESKFDQALHYLNEIAREKPSAEVFMALTATYLRCDKAEKAITALEKAAEHSNNNLDNIIKAVLISTGKDTASWREISSLLEQISNSFRDKFHAENESWYAKGQYLKTVAVVENGDLPDKLLPTGSKVTEVASSLYYAGCSLYRADLTVEAASYLRQIPVDSDYYKMAWHLCGHAYFELGEYTEALKAWYKTSNGQEHQVALAHLAQFWKEVTQGRSDQALKQFSVLERLESGAWDFVSDMGKELAALCYNLWQESGEKATLLKACSFDPNNKIYALEKAINIDEDENAAAEVITIAGESDQQEFYKLWIDGMVAAKKGKYEEARRKYLQIYEIHPEPEILFNIALLAFTLGNMEQASTLARKCMSRVVDCNNRLARRASILARKAEAVEVENLFHLIDRHLPSINSPLYVEQLHVIWMACMRRGLQSEIDRALKTVEALLKKIPSNEKYFRDEVINLIAYFYMQKSQFNKAIKIYKSEGLATRYKHNYAILTIKAYKSTGKVLPPWKELIENWKREGQMQMALNGCSLLLDFVCKTKNLSRAEWIEVLELSDKALSIESRRIEVLVLKRSALVNLERYDEAYKVSKIIMQAEPDVSSHMYEHAFILLFREGLDSVQRWFDRNNIPDEVKNSFYIDLHEATNQQL